MRNKVLLLLGASFSTFLCDTVLGTDLSGLGRDSRRTGSATFSSAPSQGAQLLDTIKESSAVSEEITSKYTVALAVRNQDREFFGYHPYNRQEMSQFKLDMNVLKKDSVSSGSRLLASWINQENHFVKLTGFLNSFGETLTSCGSRFEYPSSFGTLPSSTDRVDLLNNAYGSMVSLITGRVVGIDASSQATREEEGIYVQAALNLGRKIASERSQQRVAQVNMVDALLTAYTLSGSPLDATTLRHNLILVSISYAEACQIKLETVGLEGFKRIFGGKGFRDDMLSGVYSSTTSLLSRHATIQPTIRLDLIQSAGNIMSSTAMSSGRGGHASTSSYLPPHRPFQSPLPVPFRRLSSDDDPSLRRSVIRRGGVDLGRRPSTTLTSAQRQGNSSTDPFDPQQYVWD